MKHVKYFRYVLIHKWHVFWACFWYGLIWRGLIHDLSKFSRIEWTPYVEYFYGGWRKDSYDGESEAPEDLALAYDYAWNHHMHVNDHHWQFYIMTFDEGDTKILPMPHDARKEMVADWIGAGRAIAAIKGEYWYMTNTCDWYEANKDNIQLHPETRVWVEAEMVSIREDYRRRLMLGISQ